MKLTECNNKIQYIQYNDNTINSAGNPNAEHQLRDKRNLSCFF